MWVYTDELDSDSFTEEDDFFAFKDEPVEISKVSTDDLVERLEENEDMVECKECFDLFPKDECTKLKVGYICPNCHGKRETDIDTVIIVDDEDLFKLDFPEVEKFSSENEMIPSEPEIENDPISTEVEPEVETPVVCQNEPVSSVEVVNTLISSEEEAVGEYTCARDNISNNPEIPEDVKNDILDTLEHIKEEEEEHIEELAELIEIKDEDSDIDSEDDTIIDVDDEESKDDPEKQPGQLLTESRSVADIEAEIAKLQQELADAKVAEKKASYGRNLPTYVWYWDIYKDPSEKGTWISLDFDTVYETRDAAITGAYKHLSELDYEDELEYDSDDYYVDAVTIPVSKVSSDALEWSGLSHLNEAMTEEIQEEEVKETAASEVEELEETFIVNPITKDDLYDRLVNKGESVELDVGDQGYSREDVGSFSDGGYYTNSTISIEFNNGKFSVTEFYVSESGDEKEGDWDFETSSFDELWDEIMDIFKPEDLVEHVNEDHPAIESDQKLVGTDNAVVDCEVANVVTHSEDEKPVDCKMKKKPLTKPLTEATEAEMQEILKLSQEIGIETISGLDRFNREEADRGATLLDRLRDYRAELGPDFKIKESSSLTESSIKKGGFEISPTEHLSWGWDKNDGFYVEKLYLLNGEDYWRTEFRNTYSSEESARRAFERLKKNI